MKHLDLDATIVKSFDALGGDDKPHRHGTAMAGAIAAHKKLMGIAPDAQLLVARAFDDAADLKGTSFAIYKSLQWAADNNARVVNMSFAGPADPLMRRLLAAAFEKGMVLVAAAGDAGPEFATALPGSRSQRHLRNRDRQQGRRVQFGQPRQIHRSGRSGCRDSRARAG